MHLIIPLVVLLVGAPGATPATPAAPAAPATPAAPAAPAAPSPSATAATAPCLSIGDPSDGWLVQPVQLVGSDRLQVRDGRNWGTPELIAAIEAGVDHLHAAFPGTYPLVVGNLSRKKGGRLRPHRSHQSGRDADIGYVLQQDRSPTYFKRATRRTLDAARTWTFIQGLLASGQLEYAFIDYRLQKPLHAYARDVAKVAPDELSRLFQYPRGRGKRVGVIRHVRGHRDHMHIRVRADASVSAGTTWIRQHPEALKPKAVKHRIKRGDNLSRIARRYRVKISDLRKWNGLSRKKKRKKVLLPGRSLTVGWRRPALP